MEAEKRSSKGGFLRLFGWKAKSQKKLFSNKPDVPESSKQGKENVENLSISRFQQMNLDERMCGTSVSGNDWTSSSSNDEGIGSKAPGVVARLMGLDSLPTLDAYDPGFTPNIYPHSSRPSLLQGFTTESETVADYGTRNKLDGFSRNPVEDKLQKFQNRPIEKFQSELPPRSAKSVPLAHHRMLSPIKSPGYILSRNAAFIMEEASKLIDQSPQSTLTGRLPSSRSSSALLRIRDLKEKMEATHRTYIPPEASLGPKTYSHVSSTKRPCRSEVVVLKHGTTGSLKNKSKSATPAKTNIQTLEGPTTRNNRSTTKQKEDSSVRSVQLDKKQRNTPKRVHSRSTTGKTPEVLKQQTQNCASRRDRTNLKPKVPRQHGRNTTSYKEVKTSKKDVQNSPRKAINNVLVKEKDRSVKCNITIDGSSNWDRKNGTDVVSFTFTSPIKKSGSDSESCSLSSGKTKSRCLFKEDTGTPSVIDSDALSVLLEQKLKELSSLVEVTECSESGTKHEYQHEHPCTSPSPESSLSDDSCITSNSTTTLTSNGNKQYMSAVNIQLLADEIELQDSATSLPSTVFESTFMKRWSSQRELEYIKEMLNYAELMSDDFAFGLDRKVISVNLFDQLENPNKNMDPLTKQQRNTLFDCVSMCLESRRELGSSGSYEEWSRWSTLFQKKDLLADEIQKEIRGWTSMEELMVDEVVEKDMSSGYGKWLDFEAEALEEGVVIGTDILTMLIDEVVVDFL